MQYVAMGVGCTWRRVMMETHRVMMDAPIGVRWSAVLHVNQQRVDRMSACLVVEMANWRATKSVMMVTILMVMAAVVRVRLKQGGL